MTLLLTPDARRREFTNLGVVAPGAKLYTYLTASGTPAPVYTTAAGAVAHQNPVVADSSGLFPAIYLTNGQQYRFTLTDTLGNVIWGPQDGIGTFAPSGTPTGLYDVTTYGATGDGTTNDAAAFIAAIAAMPATGGTLYAPPTAQSYKIGTNVSVPATVTIWMSAGAELSVSAGITVTVLGAVAIERSQWISGVGSVDLANAKITGVYPEWWGAVASKTTDGTPADSTSAIDAAINSKRDVYFDQGIYGTTGGHVVATDGQKITGQGISITIDGQGGTRLKRLSGTTRLIKFSSFYGCQCRDLVLDGNALGGEICRWQCIHGVMENVEFLGQGGTDYALYLYSTNLCSFRDLYFRDGNYGHIKTDPTQAALYPTFEAISMGQTAGGFALDLQNSIGGVWFGWYGEGPISITGNVLDWTFTGIRAESLLTTGPFATITGSTVLNVLFRDVRINQEAATTYPDFSVTSAIKFGLDNYFSLDLISAAGRSLVALDGCNLTTLRRVTGYHNNTFNFVMCSGTRTDNTTASEIFYHSGSVGSMVWKVGNLVLQNTNAPISFLASSEEIYCVVCSGVITRTNAANLFIDPVSVNGGDQINFANNAATPDVSTGMCGACFVATNSAPTTITNFANGKDGQQILVRFTDANSTVDFSANANLKGNGGVDWVSAAGASLLAQRANGVWYCRVQNP